MKSIGFLAMIVAAIANAASVEDICISFSTVGPDRYSDGTAVLDGECYALVWSKDGKFNGFDAGGKCLDENDRIVLAAPIAKDGRCPSVLFQVPAEEAAALANGQYAVYLLDTRVSGGAGKDKASETRVGDISLLNGYGAVSANLKITTAAGSALASELGGGGEGQVASSMAAVPSECVQPKIKKVRVDGEQVYLTIENLKGFMRVQGGKKVDAFDSTGGAVQTSGEGEDVILVAPRSGDTGFYKVIRNQ